MSPQILLNECREAGVTVHLAGDKLKIRGSTEAVADAVNRLRPHKQEIIHYLLDQFQFNQADHEDNPAESSRVNNMAWEFMQADGMDFSEAIRLAAEIVVHCKVVACEAAYEDVRQLWDRLKKL